ncbi:MULTISPECIES: hypothetical protein [Amycolatopsis]|uniref:Uncharacterized protein n=1 Tax=Amycolatopsis dongchuanensis TaxID=1070866 RepID=A0ABP9QY87_9PSEU|nr:hypothetical protein [Amycolatopsis sacchari]
MNVEGLTGEHYDGLVNYRVDPHGERVVVLPAICRAGRHSLVVAGYRAVADSAGVAVECQACRAEGVSPAAWHFGTAGPLAARAEFDDQPYLDRWTRSDAARPGRR